jgi:epoxyqueuosine reductase
MDIQKLKQEIIDYSKTIGIDKIGFTTADPFLSLKARLYQQQMLGYQSGFEPKDIEKRVDPSLIMEGAASIIAIGLAYPAKLSHKPSNTKTSRRGSFSRASWGTDYHVILRDRLSKLEAFILEKAPTAKLMSMVDTGDLSDRAVAERAGLGYVGKHTNLITKEFGSYLYLGEMLTSISFAPDNPIEDLCGSCTLCIDTCPTNALVQGGQLNAQKCIAFLTQKKTSIAEPYRKAIGNRVYGCDTCQQVCPYNKGIDIHHHVEMEPDPEKVKPKLKSLLFINNRTFKETFGEMAGSWRGRKPIQRNAVLALGNYKDQTAIPDLVKLLKTDPRPELREAAIWSLGKMAEVHEEDRSQIEEAFLKSHQSETDERVLKELEKGLLKLNQAHDILFSQE